MGSPIALKFRRNVVIPDNTAWGKSQFVYLSPVLTRGQTAELPKPAGIGIVFKVGPEGGLIVKSMANDGPAKNSGQIMIEDCLMSVDGKKVFGQSIVQVKYPPSKWNVVLKCAQHFFVNTRSSLIDVANLAGPDHSQACRCTRLASYSSVSACHKFAWTKNRNKHL